MSRQMTGRWAVQRNIDVAAIAVRRKRYIPDTGGAVSFCQQAQHGNDSVAGDEA